MKSNSNLVFINLNPKLCFHDGKNIKFRTNMNSNLNALF